MVSICHFHNNHNEVQIFNFSNGPHTIKTGKHTANFTILIPESTKRLKSVDPIFKSELLHEVYDDAVHYVDTQLKTLKNRETNSAYWFPTLENEEFSKYHTGSQHPVLRKLYLPKKLEQIDPKNGSEKLQQFLVVSHWIKLALQLQKIQKRLLTNAKIFNQSLRNWTMYRNCHKS